jgi:hypothetical protein
MTAPSQGADVEKPQMTVDKLEQLARLSDKATPGRVKPYAEQTVADAEFAAELINFWRSGGAELARDYQWLLMNMRVLRAGADGARHYIDVPPANSLAEAIHAARQAGGEERD